MTVRHSTLGEAGFDWPSRSEWTARRKRPPFCYMDRPTDDAAWEVELRRRAEIEQVFGPVPQGDQAALEAAMTAAGWTPDNTPLLVDDFVAVL